MGCDQTVGGSFCFAVVWIKAHTTEQCFRCYIIICFTHHTKRLQLGHTVMISEQARESKVKLACYRVVMLSHHCTGLLSFFGLFWAESSYEHVKVFVAFIKYI